METETITRRQQLRQHWLDTAEMRLHRAVAAKRAGQLAAMRAHHAGMRRALAASRRYAPQGLDR